VEESFLETDDKDRSMTFYRIGNEFYEKGRFRRAVWFYNYAVLFDRSNYKAFYNRGLAKACLENYDAAIEDFRRVLELKNFAECHYVLGLAYEYKKSPEDAKREYREALNLDPDFKDAQNRLESCESKQAKANSSHSGEAGDDQNSEVMEKARKLVDEGNISEAIATIEDALKSRPDQFHLLLYRRILKTGAPTDHEMVIGYDQLKAIIRRKIIIPIKYRDHPIFRKSPISKHFKGILLYGPPGCGKTMLVENLAREEGFVYIEVVMSEVLNLYYGESEKRLTAVFDRAREAAKDGTPVLIFIDECDALGHSRTITPDSNQSRLDNSLIATFLRLFNEIKNISNLAIIAATNRPWSVDEALKRPGRLGSSIIYCPPPDEETRETMFKNFSKETPDSETLDYKKLSELSAWFSGDDIRNVCADVFDEIAEETIDTEIKKHSEYRTQETLQERYVRYIRHRIPQTLCWMQKVAQASLRGQIETSEIDSELRDDITRLVSNDSPPATHDKQNHHIPYAC
jgi:SpoVK/Ycf46/Vps4 family AAA+-type ATPase